MLNKPINALTLLVVVIWAAFSYSVIAGLANFKLLHDLLSGPEPLSLETMSTSLGRVDACLAPWLGTMFASCLIGAACFSGGGHSGSTSWAYEDHDDASFDFAWSRSSDDDFRVNPATGLPMVGGIGGCDVNGNAFGASD